MKIGIYQSQPMVTVANNDEAITQIINECGLTTQHCKAVIEESQRLINSLGHNDRYQSVQTYFSSLLNNIDNR